MSLTNPDTYAGWITLIREWLDIAGQDVTDNQIGYSLTLAQDELNKVLNSWRMEKDAPLTALVDGPLPLSGIADFNRVQLITAQPYDQPLLAWAFNELVAAKAEVAAGGRDNPAQKTHYAIQAQKVHTFPTAATGDVLTIYYYGIVPPLSVSVPTNIFSTYHEEALLYASLVAASQFISEDERTPGWVQLLNQAVTSINDASKGSKMGSTPLVRNFKT